jgi:3',5'-cyclic AMP phosphodiesterase CpdA
MLTIAQITDLHVTTGKDPLNRARNERRLRQVMAAIRALKPQPVAVVVSGDLVDRGEPEEYAALKTLLAELDPGVPVHLGLGNHDNRENFLAAFGGPTDDNGFVQYAADLGEVRLVVCDSLDQGAEGGGFCEDRAAWLARTLDAAPDQPTIIAIHHPPMLSGVAWMDPDPAAPWITRLADVIRPRRQVAGLVCGHIHRAITGQLGGHPVTATAATSIQLTLDMRPVDMADPDGREILTEEPPAYGLIYADRGQVAVHACVAGDYTPAVHYTRPFRAA